jgi:hypothetical protein
MHGWSAGGASETSLKILLLGNCQTGVISKLLEVMVPGVSARTIDTLPAIKRREDGDFEVFRKPVSESSLIFLNYLPDSYFYEVFARLYPESLPKVRFIPGILFSAFHPDCVFVNNADSGYITGPFGVGRFHSMLGLWGWKNGLDARQTLDLFRRDVFKHVGYFDFLRISKSILTERGAISGIPLDGLLSRWLRTGSFMHSPTHPKIGVLADIARAAMAREGIETIPEVETYFKDSLALTPTWPVYPEIGERLGIPGHYYFKKPGQPISMIGLDEFLHRSFAVLSKYEKDELTCSRFPMARYDALFESKSYETLGDFLHGRMHGQAAAPGMPPKINSDIPKPPSKQTGRKNPYGELADYQFWRRAVERPRREEVDPVLRGRFQLRQDDKIATAGSCFAQHISRALKGNGFNYYVTEAGEKSFSPEDAESRNYGVYSARYGNVYTARQLLQLFDRAYGRFIPNEMPWVREDGRLVDPFRPQIEPHGFAGVEELELSRAGHLACVRELFETLDVLVFTLGLTESWLARSDGSVFPLAPGVVAGEMDPNRHEFVNFEAHQVIADMQGFIERLRSVNPHARMILTVSPVPLVATYENRHVLVSNSYSKSALRVASDVLTRRNEMCDYFPAYEIVTGIHTRGEYFEDDLRSVTQAGVAQVMDLFMTHYLARDRSAGVPSNLDRELAREAALIGDFICDEEALDPKVSEI